MRQGLNRGWQDCPDKKRLRHAVVNTWHPYLQAIEAYLGFRGRNALGRSA